MSKFEAPLTKFTLSVHSNADSLSIAHVGEWQCIVRTEDFKDEELGVYLPLDTIADQDHPLLSFLGGKRVKTCKLRGELSQGVLLAYSKVKDYMKNTLGMQEASIEKMTIEGKDFLGLLRVRRWFDESEFHSGNPDMETPHPEFQKYTDIENIKNYSDTIQFGENVQITCKLHGTNFRASLIDGTYMLGSMNCRWKIEPEKPSYWHYVSDKNNLKEKLATISEMYKSDKVILYGEIVGPKIQDLHYGCTEPTLFVFDVMVDGRYLPPVESFHLCDELSLRTVPVLKVGEFRKEDLDLRLGKSTLADHVREGIVIKPLTPRTDSKIGRVILKVISEEYLMRKTPKDKRDI